MLINHNSYDSARNCDRLSCGRPTLYFSASQKHRLYAIAEMEMKAFLQQVASLMAASAR